MSTGNELRNQLKAVRTRLGFSQQDLASAAGVARQTIGGIETGSYALSMVIALKLSKALGCPVDELFWLDDDLATIQATVMASNAGHEAFGSETHVSLARVADRWIASPLAGQSAYRREMVPADGVAVWDADGSTVNVRLFDKPDVLEQSVSIAGCTPALSLWARSAERWQPGLRILWSHANSTAALARLANREVHIAGIHLFDSQTGQDNVSYVRAALKGEAAVLVNLGIWQEGLLVAPGNPMGLRCGADLVQKGVVLANRELGAGARLLLDAMLRAENVSSESISGYARTLPGHFEVAEAVRDGRADVGVSTSALAQNYGLSFVPLQSVRYDLALRRETMAIASVQQLLATLNHRWVRQQLAAIGGYDTSHTGETTEID